jgi:hypothetical protein
MGGGLYFLSNGGVENTATGTVSGVGEIRANFFTSEGTVAPGASAGNLDSAGILHIRFGYEQESTGHLSIEIFGNDNSDPMDPEYDVLQAGTASLDGTLGVSLSSFTPSPGDEFTILDAEVLSGDFDNVANGGRLDTLDGSGSFLVTYDTDLDNVVLSDFRLAADFNFDGIIDAADYVVWRKVIGTPASYDTWRTDFGRSVLGGGGGAAETRDDGAVPEPASLALLLAGLFMSWMVRRR